MSGEPHDPRLEPDTVAETQSRSAFVVGTGRCGSTLLSDMLNLHRDVLSLSELFAMLRPYAFPAGVLSGRDFWNVLSRPRPDHSFMLRNRITPKEWIYPIDGDGRFSGSIELPPIAAAALPHLSDHPDLVYAELEREVPRFAPTHVAGHYHRLFALMAARFGRSIVIERSGSSLIYVDRLLEAFPQARFVHMVRDGPSSALSMREHHSFRIYCIGRMLESSLGFDPYLEPRPYDAAAVPVELRPLLPDRFDRDVYTDLDLPVEFFGRLWSRMIEVGLETFRAMRPGQLHTVHYGELTADPRGTLRRLGEFLELEDPDGTWLQRSSSMVRTEAPPKRVEKVQARYLERSTARATRNLKRFTCRSQT